MNSPTDDMLRHAVRNLADEARTPPDLVGEALRRGRRLRRRRRVATSVGAVAVVVALAVPYLWLRPQPPAGQNPVAEPAVAPSAPASVPASDVAAPPVTDWVGRPLAVPGGWVLAGATSTGTPAATGYALDRVGGRYIALDRYEEVWAAPNGHVAAVVDYERRDEIGLLDLRTEQVRWVATGSHVMTPQWSPDGDRLALTRMDKVSGDITLGVLTSQGTFRTYPVDRQKYFCTDRCFFTWTRDGRHVVLQQSDPDVAVSESRPAARRGIQLFSPDDGRPGAFIPVPGDPAGPWSWSPDGRLVVIRGQDGPRIAEVATGRIVGPAMGDDDVWVNEGRLLHRDLGTNAILLIDLEGRELARQSLPQALDHLTLTVGPV